MVKRLIEFSINRDYDRSVRFTILCIHVSILIRFLHTFSRMLSVSYCIVKSESRTLSNVRFWLTCKGDCSSCAILCCLENCCPLITFCEYCKRGVHAVSSKKPNVLFFRTNWVTLNVTNSLGNPHIYAASVWNFRRWANVL